ncbi:MAG: tetratricopeptide repeat protein [Chitinispirillales bacterium]|jgi:FimV-like protein|nr:tetratricopeptide repeat protein [Chitinispirillales bacterium]
MKLLEKIGLGESEQKTLKKVTIITSLLFVVIVGLFWVYEYFFRNTGSGHNTDTDKFISLIPHLQASGARSISGSELSGFDLEAHEFASVRYLQSGQADRALPHLQRILEVNRNHRPTMERMIQAYLELEDFEKALSSIDLLIYQTGDSAAENLQVRKATALYYMERGEESARIIRGVLRSNPQNAEALCFMGQIEAARKSPEALQYFLDALKAAPNYAEAKYQLARFYESEGDYKKARSLLYEVLEKDPLNVRAHARLGIVYYYDNSPELSLKSYLTALAINPHDYNTRYNLGELYRIVLNDNQNALQQFVLALKEKPHHTEANFRAGLICIENDMIKEAIRYFEASNKSDPKNIRKMIQLAAAYERLGNRKAALSVYHEITDIDPLHIIATNKIRLLNASE